MHEITTFWQPGVYDAHVRFLLLEDDPHIRAPLAASLREFGCAVDETGRASEAEGMAGMYPYDAMIVDVRLPDGPNAGFDLVAKLRAGGNNAPVLFLTARDSLEDRIHGLDVGGDDYLTKPFHMSELRAHLRALVRRARPQQAVVAERGGLRVDFNARSVTLQGKSVRLTAKEYGILELLSSNPGRVFERNEIVERVWDAEFHAETNIVDVYVKNLRRKLGDDMIETVRGIGYRFPSDPV